MFFYLREASLRNDSKKSTLQQTKFLVFKMFETLLESLFLVKVELPNPELAIIHQDEVELLLEITLFFFFSFFKLLI